MTAHKDTIFDQYTIQSAANNVINLEVPLASLQRALRSALQATSASIRLTKKNNIPLLALTIHTSTVFGGHGGFDASAAPENPSQNGGADMTMEFSGSNREKETIITQDVPVRVLSPLNVEGIHEPRCPDSEVHIMLPPLVQLKSISDRFTKLALAAKLGSTAGLTGLTSAGPRLQLAANMHGCLRLSIRTDAMNISSVWTGLSNPQLDPTQVEGGEEGIRAHPSTRMKQIGSADGRSEEGWATVRIDGKDWGKVMSVGRLGGRVVACRSDPHFRGWF